MTWQIKSSIIFRAILNNRKKEENTFEITLDYTSAQPRLIVKIPPHSQTPGPNNGACGMIHVLISNLMSIVERVSEFVLLNRTMDL